MRRRERKRLARDRVGMPILTRPNQEWSIDFVSDALANGRAIRSLTVLDDFTKESLAIEVDTSLSGLRVTRVLDRIIAERGSWRARSIGCRGQPLLDKLYKLHHCQMDSIRVTRDETILAESTQPVPGKFVITVALVVLVHTVVMLIHGVAHMRLNVELSPWAGIYVLCIVGIGPIAGLLFLRSSRKRAGATVLLITMIGALLFGLWKHFMAHGADHVMDLQAGPWRLPFQATAVLLAVSEAAGAVIAFVLLRALTPRTKPRDAR